MSWTSPQGISFRATAGYVTDPTNVIYEISEALFTPNYPRTLGGGNVVGYEVSGSGSAQRDRSGPSGDPRLNGIHQPTSDYRFDVTPGTYNIYVAAGDKDNSQSISMIIKDNTTTLTTLSGSTGAANSFIDAAGNVRTAAAWVAQSAGGGSPYVATISSSIIRFSFSNSAIAHIFIEQTGGGGGGVLITQLERGIRGLNRGLIRGAN